MKAIPAVFAAAIMIALASPAGAEDGKTTVRLSLDAATAMDAALKSLSTYQDGVDANNHPVTKYYKFTPATRVLIAQDIAALEVIVDAGQASRDQLLSDAMASTHGAPIKTDSPVGQQFVLANNKLGRGILSFDLDTIPEDDLDLADNPIPVQTLAAIAAIIVSK